MKQAITLFSGIIIGMNLLFAQAESTVFSDNGEKFWVIVNGIKQNDKPVTQVKIGGLDAPMYKFKIIFEDASIPSIDKSIMTKDTENNWMRCSYIIRKNKKGVRVMNLSSYAAIKTTTTTTTTTTSGGNPSGGNANMGMGDMLSLNFRADENTNNVVMGVGVGGNTVTTNVGAYSNGAGVGIRVNDGSGQNVNMNVGVNGTTTQTTTTQTTTTYQNTQQNNTQQNNTQQNTNRVYCDFPVASWDFAPMKESISKQSFTDTQLKMAKDIIRKNCMSTGQIKDIMSIFSFEDTKLDWAKFAYDYCSDKNNYYQLNDGFSFSSSVDDLSDYLSHK